MHFLNFRTTKKLDAKFEYIFRLVSVCLVQPNEEPEFLTPSRRKRGPNKWMILPYRAKIAPKVVNPLDWPTTSCPGQNAPRTEGSERRNDGRKKEVDSWKGGKKIH